MVYFRNLLLFVVVFLTIAGCGGGNTTIAANNSSGGSTSSGGTNNGSPGTTYGSATLQWIAPTTLSDGTTAVSLSDISGYEIFYGSSATNTPNMFRVNGGSTSQYKVTLPTGTYYFVICAIDSNGIPGLRSVALQKSI